MLIIRSAKPFAKRGLKLFSKAHQLAAIMQSSVPHAMHHSLANLAGRGTVVQDCLRAGIQAHDLEVQPQTLQNVSKRQNRLNWYIP